MCIRNWIGFISIVFENVFVQNRSFQYQLYLVQIFWLEILGIIGWSVGLVVYQSYLEVLRILMVRLQYSYLYLYVWERGYRFRLRRQVRQMRFVIIFCWIYGMFFIDYVYYSFFIQTGFFISVWFGDMVMVGGLGSDFGWEGSVWCFFCFQIGFFVLVSVLNVFKRLFRDL